jgi:hypothetical protein
MMKVNFNIIEREYSLLLLLTFCTQVNNGPQTECLHNLNIGCGPQSMQSIGTKQGAPFRRCPTCGWIPTEVSKVVHLLHLDQSVWVVEEAKELI